MNFALNLDDLLVFDILLLYYHIVLTSFFSVDICLSLGIFYDVHL